VIHTKPDLRVLFNIKDQLSGSVIMAVILPSLMNLDPAVYSWLCASGWQRDRRVKVPQSVPETHPAFSLLESFGGLSLYQQVDSAVDAEPICEIQFTALNYEAVETHQWNEILDTELIGIGGAHNEHEQVFAGSKGRIFAASLIHDAFYFHGITIEDYLFGLLTGRRARPMLRPDQNTVTLYGLQYSVGDPEVYPNTNRAG